MKLMELVRRRLRELRYSRRTEEAYIQWIRRFIEFHDRRHPIEIGAPEVVEFLSWLAVEQKVAQSTQKQAQSALIFLYDRVLERPLPLLEGIAATGGSGPVPTVLSVREIRALFRELAPLPRLCAGLMYGSGLRISECISVRVKDIDFDRHAIIVRDGKGGKDRRAPLGVHDADAIQLHLEGVRDQFDEDMRRGIRTTMPFGALDRKLPNADRDWRWRYVFPSTRTVVDDAGVRRRHHIDATVLQRAIPAAAMRAGLTKRITCHTLRHSFATHVLEQGVDIRRLQEAMGHTDVRTTQRYTHVTDRGGAGVPSPTDRL